MPPSSLAEGPGDVLTPPPSPPSPNWSPPAPPQPLQVKTAVRGRKGTRAPLSPTGNHMEATQRGLRILRPPACSTYALSVALPTKKEARGADQPG